MEHWGTILGAVVAAALGTYLYKKNPGATRSRRIVHGLLVVLVAAAASAGGAFVGQYLRMQMGAPSGSDIDRMVQRTQELPLLRVVFEDNPALLEKLRAIVEDELRHPGRVPSPAVEFGAALRAQYVLPALQGADDAPAMRAAASMGALARHLQATNVDLCREFGLTGLQDPKKLDRRGTALLKESLAAQEDAYRNGKAAAPKAALTDEQFGQLLSVAGYKDADFQQLAEVERLPAVDACNAVVKLYSVPGALSPPQAGAFARWLLMAQ